MNLRLFEFDYDLTWYVFFLNADETIYGRYGGRDATDAESRISTKGLRYAMGKALEMHKNPPKVKPLEGKPIRAEEFKAARNFRGCIHCHNVKEFQRADAKAAGTWTRDDIWVYPLPENIGITLDNDVGNKVRTVLAKSQAERAGIRAGDLLQRINTYSIASFGDAIYALHKSPSKGLIELTWERDGKQHSSSIELAEGWRKTNITWRPSMLELLPEVPFSGGELTVEDREKWKIPEGRAAFRQDKFVHSTLKVVGILPNDIIIGFDGVTVEGKMDALLGYVRRNYLVGDTVTIDLLRDGKLMHLKWTLK